MWKPLLILISFLLAALLAVPAWANSEADIRALIDSGNYAQAYEDGQKLNSAEGFALAAESLSTQILLGEVNKLNKRSKEARDLSEKALALNPSLYEAKLQYALTDGFVTRTSGDLTAWRKKLPMKTLEKIEIFRADYPEDPLGMALEGAWHMGVVRKTGEKNGRKWFGASLSEGLRLYDLARKNNPDDVLIETNYVMSLLVLNAEHYANYVRPILENISGLQAVTDLERKVQSRAVEVLNHYDKPRQVETLAAKFLDGN